MKTLRSLLPTAFVLLLPTVSCASGFCHSENFLVMAATQELAEKVLAQAEVYRSQLAMKWLGEQLRHGDGRTLICVDVSPAEERGHFLPVRDGHRKLHMIRITCSENRATGKLLEHEVTHLVTHIAFQGTVPLWADEGIALLQDQERIYLTRQEFIRGYVRDNRWPNLEKLLEEKRINSTDYEFCSTAVSLTTYLLTRGGPSVLLSFARAGGNIGWDSASQQCYDMRLRDLQAGWQSWAEQHAMQEATPRKSSPVLSRRVAITRLRE